MMRRCRVCKATREIKDLRNGICGACREKKQEEMARAVKGRWFKASKWVDMENLNVHCLVVDDEPTFYITDLDGEEFDRVLDEYEEYASYCEDTPMDFLRWADAEGYYIDAIAFDTIRKR